MVTIKKNSVFVVQFDFFEFEKMHFACLIGEIEPGQKILLAISLVRLAIWEKKIKTHFACHTGEMVSRS